MKAIAQANVNIALVKYWGKKCEELKLPFSSSISFTLDHFYTITEVEYDEKLIADTLEIDGKDIVGEKLIRAQDFMTTIRKLYDTKLYAKIASRNHVPISAGLASSSSAFCALALAATKALDLDLTDEDLSRLARLGSGSACRSVFGDFVIWEAGTNHLDSHAYEFAKWDEFRLIVCLLDETQKDISSSKAMYEATKLPNYLEYVKKSELDFESMKKAILNKDICVVGRIAQRNALMMHEIINDSGINYINDKTQNIMDRVIKLQETIPVYFTIDAGPNVKLLTVEKHVDVILNAFSDLNLVVNKAGKGVEIINEN